MRLNPKTEKELAEAGLLPKGEYDFEIVKSEEAVSKAGNEMIALTLKVYDQNGASTLVNDYLMDKLPLKLRHAAEACGLLEDYERGQLHADDMVGKPGRVKLIVQADKTGQYPDRNSVQDYIVQKGPEGGWGPAAGATTASRPREMADIDDEIPF